MDEDGGGWRRMEEDGGGWRMMEKNGRIKKIKSLKKKTEEGSKN